MVSADVTVDAMLREASEGAGLDDFGSDHFMEPLRLWCDDLRSDRLTEYGREFLRRQALTDLTRRLQVIDTLHRHPEIDEFVLPRIVWIIGPGRSGTTLLHNLLACHRGARALLRWELVEPVPPPEAATYHSDPRINRVQQKVERMRGTTLEQMHWIEATDPEECAWGMVDCFGTMGNGAVTCLPTYREFINSGRGRSESFREYRRVLQLHLWRNPVQDRGFLVLKAPQFVRHLRAVADEFPEASFVLTHRDPFRTVTSGLSLLTDLTASCVVAADWGALLEGAIDDVRATLTNLIDFARSPASPTAHVCYPELMGAPVATATNVLGEFEAPDDPGLVSAIEQFLAAQRAGRRKPPPTELPTFGVEQDKLWAEPIVKEYADLFGLLPERKRLVDVSPTA